MYFFLVIVKILSRLPFGVLYVLSDLMYYPLYYIIRYRRKVVRQNLTESFPEKSSAEILRIEKDFYHYFADMILESTKLATISPEEMKRRLKFVNPEFINDVLSQGKSATAFVGHFGNWEWMVSATLWLNRDIVFVQVYHQLSNPTADKVIKQIRQRMGSVCVEMRQTARFVNSTIEKGKPLMLALAADQSPKRRDIKHYVKFLNHEVPVLVGPEKMTLHYDCTPFFVVMRRIKRGYYEMEVIPLCVNQDTTQAYPLTELYYQHLEHEIRQHPELYLWTHKRFRYAR